MKTCNLKLNERISIFLAQNEKIESLEKLNTELTSAQQNDSLKQSEELEKLRKSIGDYETKISQLMEQNGSFTSQIDSLRKQNSELSSCLHKVCFDLALSG